MRTKTPNAHLLAFMYLLLIAMIVGTVTVSAVEIGESAPNFKLQSTTGEKISLSQFRGKKNVLLQFYSMDFNPA